MLKKNILAMLVIAALLCTMMAFSVTAEAADGNVAKIGETEYATLAEAVAAAADGDTIMLLANTTGAGVVINKNITIDLGGFTYSFNQGVGSTGTESNGLQILKGNTVTIQNGTLNIAAEAADKFYTVIQNYANLTLTNVTVDATNADKWSKTDGDSYAVSINSGKVAFNGNTSIIANNDGALAFAFDACQKGTYEIPVITVNTTGTITGNIEVTGGTLAIQAATINGTLVYASGSVTKADAVTLEAPADYKWDNGNLISKAYIARIGNTYYATLADAVAAANDCDVIVLLDNIDLGTEMLSIKKKITINLNGKTITSAYTGDYAAIYVGTAGDLTVTGEGTITTTGDIAIGSYGKVTIQGGTITAKSAALYNYYHNETTFGTATIAGGKLDTVWNSGVMEVTGGEIAYLDNSHKLIVTAGTVKELLVGVADYAPVNGTTATVADGTVQKADSAARIGNVYYATLAEAVAAANEGDTIVLLKAVVVGNGETLTIDKNVTITTSVTDAFTVNAGGTLNLKNVTVNGTSSVLWANGGIINIDGATLSSTGSQYTLAFAENNGQINMKSGKILIDSCSAVAARNNGIINISGGEIKTTAETSFCAAFAGSGAQLVITGGEISAANGYGVVAVADGKVTISGGTVKGVLAHENANASVAISGGTINGSVAVANGATVTVTGGSFEQDVTEFCAAEHHVIKGEDGRCVCGPHAFSTEWTTDKENHWHECDCGAIADQAEHTYENGICTECDKKDSIDETGDTVLVSAAVIMMLSAAAVVLLSKKRLMA